MIEESMPKIKLESDQFPFVPSSDRDFRRYGVSDNDVFTRPISRYGIARHGISIQGVSSRRGVSNRGGTRWSVTTRGYKPPACHKPPAS
jgi:hypothetical protein